jgi:hypothetical protein
MGVEAARRINGPWLMEVEFPRLFSSPVIPETHEEIVESIQILTPPTPVYAAVGGGNPIGLYISGAYPFKHIKLPVFEWTGWEVSVTSPFPIRNESYFALSNKFKKESLSTPRVTIGKVAVQDDVVACSMPIIESRLSKPFVVEIGAPSQPDIRESVAQAIFSILSGESQQNGFYTESNFEFAVNRAKKRNEAVQKIKLDRKPRSKLQKLLNRI